MPSIITDVVIPTDLVYTPIIYDDTGTDVNIAEYDRLIKPSFTNIVGNITLEDGGYFGKLLSVVRVHLDDMKEKSEVSNEIAGQVYASLIGQAMTESIAFEQTQLTNSMDFARKLVELEIEKNKLREGNIKFESDKYTYENILPLQDLLAKQEALSANATRILTEQQAISENIKAGGDTTDNPVDITKSLAFAQIKDSNARADLSEIQRVLKTMEAGSVTGDAGSHSYNESLPYLERMLLETRLGNSGTGIKLEESENFWKSRETKAKASIQATQAGGSGTTEDIDYTKSSPYISRLLDETRLGNTGNGINLEASLGRYETLLTKGKRSLENIKAGGNGIDDAIAHESSLPYLQITAEKILLGDKGDGLGIQEVNSMNKFLVDEAEAKSQIANFAVVDANVRSGGNGIDLSTTNKDTSLAYFENRLKQLEVEASRQKAGLSPNSDTVVDGTSVYINQAESVLAQTDMYKRQTIAFGERKDQQLLDSVLKYNMMVFPDNDDAQLQIPDGALKSNLDALITKLGTTDYTASGI